MASRSRSVAKIWSVTCSAGLHRVERLLEDDGERVGLLARRAAGHPGAQHAAVWRRVDSSAGSTSSFKLVPGRRIAKEARDADQQLLEEQVDLLRVLPQVADVVVDACRSGGGPSAARCGDRWCCSCRARSRGRSASRSKTKIFSSALCVCCLDGVRLGPRMSVRADGRR